MNIKEVDVLIIGAGPAGSLAAREASKNGAKTLIIDKKSEIGTPKRCAEGIMSGVLERVHVTPDERWIARKIDGARIVSPNNTSAWFTPETLETPATGIILERKVFDKHMTMDAIREGAEVMIKTEALSMKREGDGYLVDIKSFNKEYNQIKAHIVIGADGPEGHVARWAELNTKVPLAEMESGLQYEMTNLKMKNNSVIQFFFGSVAPGGYAWIFPKGYDTANVGIDISGIKAEKSAVKYLNDFIANCDETKDGQIVDVRPYYEESKETEEVEKKEAKPKIMIRIVDVRRMLMSLKLKSLMAVSFQITDPLIPENNRYVTMTGTEFSGLMLMDGKPEISEGILSVSALGELVFGAKTVEEISKEEGVSMSGRMASELEKIIPLSRIYLNEAV